MPWAHCDNDLRDDVTCPSCGVTKEAWTVEFEVTRQFRIKRPPLVRLVFLSPSDEGVPDEPYRVQLPDGSVVEGRLDEAGTAKVRCADPGECTVVFPRWCADDLEVVAGGGEPEGGGGGSSATGGEGSGSEAAPASEEEPAPASYSVPTGKRLRVKLKPPELYEPHWSADDYRFGEGVELVVRTRGIARGEAITFEALEHDADGGHDFVMLLEAPVRGGEASIGWRVPWVDDADDEPTEIDRQTNFSLPEFVFVARWGQLQARCEETLEFRADLELPLEDASGEPLGEVDYELRCGGEVKQGTTDAQGVLREQGVGPNFEVRLADGRCIRVETAITDAAPAEEQPA